MPMEQNGLAKLIEECGETLQIAGKLIQYPYHQAPGYPGVHPDGTHLRTRLQEELSDLRAAILFVEEKLKLNPELTMIKTAEKFALFWKWDNEV